MRVEAWWRDDQWSHHLVRASCLQRKVTHSHTLSQHIPWEWVALVW